MKSKTKVVVIGGGAVGVSMLYHLAKKGWSDVVLVERKELTSGSTWHAAGLLPLFNMSYSVGQLHKYAVNLYKTLEEETGKNVGFSVVSNIRLAQTKDRMDEYHQYAGVAKTIGVNVKFLKPEQVKEIWPLCNIEGLVGAIQHPEDGYIQPADVTQALATGARSRGAEIYRNTVVTSIKQNKDGWVVVTDKGDITCEHVVSCSGNFARQTGKMVGLEIPVIPVQHQYIVTEPHPEIQKRKKEGKPEMGVLRDSDYSWYMREEAGGLILGPYERGAPCCYVNGPSKDSEYELFQEDLDRLGPHIESAIKRVPAFGEVGVKKVYNGAICYTPDGNPIVGPAWGLKNFWINEGHSFGITAAGGAGWQLAEWIIDGEPSIDIWAMDVARFGNYASPDYGTIKSSENYERRFIMTFPNETLPKGRRQKTTSLYDRLVARGAVMGDAFGLESALWFAKNPRDAHEEPTFKRSRSHNYVAGEVEAVRNAVGATEIANFAKHEITGTGSRKFLDHIMAGRIPKPGRIALTPMLTPKGKLYGDLTVACFNEEKFMIFGSGAAQEMHRRWFEKFLPKEGVNYKNRSDDFHGIAISGPNSRKLLSRICRDDVSAEALKFRDTRETFIGGVPAILNRISFSGELGYEIYVAPQFQLKLFEEIEANGKDLGLKLYGSRALMSLRLEKNWGVWTMD